MEYLWGFNSMEESFKFWFQEELIFKLLQIFVNWSIWIGQTRLFLKMLCQMSVFALLRVLVFLETRGRYKYKIPKMLYPPSFTPFSTVGFFYRASQSGKCGCRMLIKLNNDHVIGFWMNGGVGSNT